MNTLNLKTPAEEMPVKGPKLTIQLEPITYGIFAGAAVAFGVTPERAVEMFLEMHHAVHTWRDSGYNDFDNEG